jgi:acyl carrier protein
MAHKPDLAGLVRGRWTREQVAARVREIVIEQLDCASSYREDASFVQDLGAD